VVFCFSGLTSLISSQLDERWRLRKLCICILLKIAFKIATRCRWGTGVVTFWGSRQARKVAGRRDGAGGWEGAGCRVEQGRGEGGGFKRCGGRGNFCGAQMPHFGRARAMGSGRKAPYGGRGAQKDCARRRQEKGECMERRAASFLLVEHLRGDRGPGARDPPWRDQQATHTHKGGAFQIIRVWQKTRVRQQERELDEPTKEGQTLKGQAKTEH
jgi:hypothetical protein